MTTNVHNTLGIDQVNPLMQGFTTVLESIPFDLSGGPATPVAVDEWINQVRGKPELSPLLGFQSGIEYTPVDIQKLTDILVQEFNSPEFARSGTLGIGLENWREIQGQKLMEQLPKAMSQIAGGTLGKITASRVRISQILSTGTSASWAKALVAAWSFSIMYLFQMKFMESLLQAIAQHDINKGKTWVILNIVQDQMALGASGQAWAIMTSCLFAYLVKTGFETYLSDLLNGTKSTKKIAICALASLVLLWTEMIGSFSRVTSGHDLQEQVEAMYTVIHSATTGDTTKFADIARQARETGTIYMREWQLLADTEARRWWVWPYAAAKAASYKPQSEIDLKLVEKIPGLHEKVDAFYAQLEAQREKMKEIQKRNWIKIVNGSSPTTGPQVLASAGYHFDRVAADLDTVAGKEVRELLATHDLIDPGFAHIIKELLFDNAKKLHPDEVNALRKRMDQYVDKSTWNIDELVTSMSRTIDIIDGFMRDMTDAANRAYPKSPLEYSPKEKPKNPDTSALKNALAQTRVPVSVLDPFWVWSRFMELTAKWTISTGYSLALFLRVLLVEGILLSIWFARVHSLRRSLNTPGARYQDLSRETEGQYLDIIRKISAWTDTPVWRSVCGEPLSAESIHTIVMAGIGSQNWHDSIGNHMSAVNWKWRSIGSHWTQVRELLASAFFGKYAAPELRRLNEMDWALAMWKADITGRGVTTKQDKTNWQWVKRLWELVPKVSKKAQATPSVNSPLARSWADFRQTSSAGLATVQITQGPGNVVNNIGQHLSWILDLDNLAHMTQRRLAWESQKGVMAEWVRLQDELRQLFVQKPTIRAELQAARANNTDPLFSVVSFLDTSGDMFWYYAAQNREFWTRIRQLANGKTEAEFYDWEWRLIAETAQTLRSSLLKLQQSWLISDESISGRIQQINALSDQELLEPQQHAEIVAILQSLKDNRYFTTNIITDPTWQTKQTYNTAWLSQARTNMRQSVAEAKSLNQQIEANEKYMNLPKDWLTEFRVMELRNAVAGVKQRFWW